MTAPRIDLLLDLWMALGFDSLEFDPYFEEHGAGETWARMLDVVRGPRTPCLKPIDGGDDRCVLAEGHDSSDGFNSPCWGADDVGPPNDLLVKYWALRGAS